MPVINDQLSASGWEVFFDRAVGGIIPRFETLEDVDPDLVGIRYEWEMGDIQSVAGPADIVIDLEKVVIASVESFDLC